jgi:hypothetical protein
MLAPMSALLPFVPAHLSADGALEALCFFIQLGITGLGLVLGLVFFAVGRGVADEAKKPWNVALAVTGVLVLLGWVGLLLLVVAL